MRRQPGGNIWRRILAIAGCAALLYFAAGGSVLHHHTAGPDNTACHICQALHMPALATAPLALPAQSHQVAWQIGLAVDASPLDSFTLHRASRAPPSL